MQLRPSTEYISFEETFQTELFKKVQDKLKVMNKGVSVN